MSQEQFNPLKTINLQLLAKENNFSYMKRVSEETHLLQTSSKIPRSLTINSNSSNTAYSINEEVNEKSLLNEEKISLNTHPAHSSNVENVYESLQASLRLSAPIKITNNNLAIRAEPDSEVTKHRTQAKLLEISNNFEEAICFYTNSQQINQQKGNIYESAIDLEEIAKCYERQLESSVLLPESKEQVKGNLELNYKIALDCFSESESVDGQIRVCKKLVTFYKQNKDIKHEIDYKIKIFELEQAPFDNEARRVEQHEVGFSNSFKMGTDNIHQCIAIIIRNPETKKTALAHFDINTTPDSLENEVIATFDRNEKLEVTLIGGFANFPEVITHALSAPAQEFNTHINTAMHYYGQSNQILEQYALLNIVNVLSVLQNSCNTNLSLVAANIVNKNNISAITIDPITGNIENAMPAFKSPDRWLREGMISVDGGSSPLREAFDINESRKPLLISESQLKKAYTFFACNDYVENYTQKVVLYSSMSPGFSENWAAKMAKGKIEIIKEVMKQKELLSEEVESRIHIKDLKGLYIGEGTESLNLELVRSEQLFIDKTQGQNAQKVLNSKSSNLCSDASPQVIASKIRKTLEGAQHNTYIGCLPVGASKSNQLRKM